MKGPQIKRVESNKSKGKTYSALLRKYKEAIENGYYGEAELIVYAFLEDRLRSFIYYSDLLDNLNSNKTNENAQSIYGGELDIKNISSKISLIRKALNTCDMKVETMSSFEKDLRKRYKASVNRRELKRNLKRIEKWCGYRNEIVHASFNKDLDALRQGYKQHVEEGMELARYVDGQVKSLKKA